MVAAENSRGPGLADVVCDGFDDQVEIQQAVDALAGTGGRIVLREGTYHLSGSLFIHSNVTLMGQGKGTRLFMSDGASASTIVVDALGAGKPLEGVTIADLSIDGNYRHQRAGHGIELRADPTNTVFDALVRDCQVRYVFGSGIYATFTSEVIYSNCHLGFNLNGIEVANSSESVITGCIISEGRQDGIHIPNGSDITITGCHLEELDRFGLFLAADLCAVVGCMFFHNKQHGLYLEGASRNSILACRFRDNSAGAPGQCDGLHLRDSRDNVITGCTATDTQPRKSQRYGVCEDGRCDGNIITGCHLLGNASGGVHKVGGGTVVQASQV